MKKALTAIALSLLALAAAAQSNAEIDRLVEQTMRNDAMRHARLAVCVQNISTGKTLYSSNAEAAMTPASVQKLLTTGTGFAKLGSDFRFKTAIAVRGTTDRDGVLHGNIYIIGGGDPMLGSYRYRQTTIDTLFESWTTALRKKGIRKVDGRVCYITSIFDEQPLHDSWQWGDVGNYYGAGVSGLNFHENMYFVYFNPGKRIGYPASAVGTKPKNLDIRGICEVTTGSENSGDNVVIYGTPTSNERLYRGTVPLGKNNFAVRGAMPNPARTCADLFAAHLRSQGVSISGNSMQVYSVPDSLRAIVDYYSTDYYALAQYTNLTSNNIYAEAIFKYLGYSKYGLGSFSNGARAVADYLQEKHISTDGIRIVDGSGLSRLNRLTPAFLCSYLTAMATEGFSADFRQSLAKVGQSGTAKNMLPALPKDITVMVKTGSMDGVKSYAGYIVTRRGDMLSFAIMASDFDASQHTVGELMNRLLLKIATTY